jgi:hypothetical protein
MEIEKNINDRTYSQVTLKLSKTIVSELKESQWFDTLGIKMDTTDSDVTKMKCLSSFYAHGIGRNLFTKRLVMAIIHTFKSNL